jgi:uncharacterized damage-inducible protein DinB
MSTHAKAQAADPITSGLAHDLWATDQLLASMASLSSGQLHQTFPIGLGSLHETIVHNMGAIRVWTDVLARREVRPWITPPNTPTAHRTIDQLKAEYEANHADLCQAAGAGPMHETLTRIRNDKTFTYTRATILIHIFTHNAHHRAQAINMLRQLSCSPLPKSSTTEWCIDQAFPPN